MSTPTQPSELARTIAAELAHDPITFELSEERFTSHVATLIDSHLSPLRAENERLREALKAFMRATQTSPHMDGSYTHTGWNIAYLNRAYAAALPLLSTQNP